MLDGRPFVWSVMARLFPLLLAAFFALGPSLGAAEPVPAAPAAAAAPREILIINSYQVDYVWTREIMRGILSELDRMAEPHFLHIEFMGSKYLYDANIEAGFTALYRAKYKDRNIALVICSDENAFHFLRAKRDELFPGAPVVFCGVNEFKPWMLEGHADFTGVVEDNDMARNLELALQFHPGIKHVDVIGDETITMRLVKEHMRELEPRFAGLLDFTYLPDDPLDTLIGQVKNLPEDTIIYYLALHKDNQGGVYNAEEALDRLSRATSAPIYGNWTFLLGHGLIGGLLCDGFEQGRVAGDMAVRILRGESPQAIPVVLDSPNLYRFDYAALNRFQIDRRQLPPNSQVVNEPDPFYRLNKQAFWTLIFGMAGLAGLTLLLVAGILKRRRIESALVQSEEELRGAEEKYRSIFENSALGIFRSTLDGRYLDANPAMAALMGFDSPAQMTQSVGDLFEELYADPGRARGIKKLIERSLAPFRFENRYRRKDGRIITANVSIRPVRDKRGQVVSIEGFMEDATEKIDLERALVQSQKMEAMGTLAGGIAHDFNNILTSVINSIELALPETPDASPGKRDLSRALAASRRGADLVKQILAFSRADKEEFAPVDLTAVISDTLHMLEASLPRNIQATAHCGVPDARILGNATRIQQVLMNLCANAFQAMRETGGRLDIELAEEERPSPPQATAQAPEGFLKIAVTDTGPGIPPEVADKIFDPFFTTKPKGEGTGLGLSVAHGIIKAHGGMIGLDSAPGEGARFVIYLPKAGRAQARSVQEEHAGSHGSGMILYVEDDADQFFTIPRVIESLGYTVIAQRDPREALDIFSRRPEHFTAVVTDFDMPGINGVELARAILAANPRLPVVLVTGRRAEAEAALGGAALTILAKPYNRDELARALRQAGEAAEDAAGGQSGGRL
jgi:PAS domain S-box-containing protein